MRDIRFVVFTAAALLTLACERAMEHISGHASEVDMAISFRTAPDTYIPTTRIIEDDLGVNEGLSADYKVSDFWLMQFDDAGNLIGSPRYYRTSDYEGSALVASVVLPPDGVEYTCVVIANTHSDMFYAQMGDVTTLSKLRKSFLNVGSESDLYQENGASSKDLLMNGMSVLSSSMTSLDFELYRNIAKVVVQVTNKANSNVNIESVQIKNVPDIVYYVDQLLKDNTPCPTPSEASFFNYPIEDMQMDASASDQTTTLSFYLPRNVQGNTSSTTAEGKNNGAPTFASYVEILAEDSINEIPLRYTFYLGADTVNDFNVIPNHEYFFPITISGTGNPELDSRVESLGTVTLSDANSFIVNPLSGSMQPVFQVTTERVNTFWGSVDGNSSNLLVDNSEWIVEVIWQDADHRVIDFCDASGKVIVDGSTEADRYEGTGYNSFYFKTRQVAYSTECNILLGLRLKSDLSNTISPQYLWSWHIWITSYDPISTEEISDNKFVYSARSGGELHRYADAHTGTVWATTYKTKLMMDRNLGARSADGTSSKELTAGFYYQWGRKDPFPYNIPLYDVDGERITWNESYSSSPDVDHDPVRAVPGPALFSTSVYYPYAFYTKDAVGGDWLSKNPYGGEWNNPGWYSSESGKSFFDPCPAGWRLPDNNVWRIFQKEANVNNSPTNAKLFGSSCYNGIGLHFYISAIQSDQTVDAPVAFYPGVYRRHPYTATIDKNHSTVSNWGCFEEHLYSIPTTSNYNRKSSRSTGYPVRCIQE